MKKETILIFLFFLTFHAFAQDPVVRIGFEDREQFNTVTGINGKAFDLGNVPNRFAFEVKNPLKNEDSFTVTLWVKGDLNASSPYDILTGITILEEKGQGWKHNIINGIAESKNDDFNGWKIGMQSNGAWRFTAKGEKFTYEYEPMPSRQSIRDGHWHLLAVSYDKIKAELRFYYDGEQVAIYYAPDLNDMVSSASLVVGNSLDSDHDYRENQWDSFYGQIDDISIYNRVLNTNEIADYFQEITGKEIPERSKTTPKTLKVTAFNIFHGGNETGKDIGKERIIELLKQEGADVFTLVETYGSGEEIADALGYQLYLISSNLSIISRYPITATYPIYQPFNSGGAQVVLPGGQKVNVFSVWLDYLPGYKRPFFNNENINLEEYLTREQATRGAEMEAILKEIDDFLRQSEKVPVIIGGDFNSGSHLDWIEATASLHNNYTVPWPVSIAASKAGLVDTYRQIHPDPLKFPGVTFSLLNNTSTYIKDRIDYIYYKGEKLTPLSSAIISEHSVAFPSDHGGVSTLFKLNVDL